MSTSTSRSAAETGSSAGTGSEAGPDAPGSSEPVATADDGGWLSAANGGTTRSVALVVILLIGLIAGGAISLLVVERRVAGGQVVDTDTPPIERNPAAADAERPANEAPPERPRPQEDVSPTPKWRPGGAEVYPNAKQLASRVVEHMTDFDSGSRAREVAAETARKFNVGPSKLRRAAQELVRVGASSTGVIVYPQLGGIRADSASVMVVVDQTLDDGEKTWVERRTVDVRLVLRGEKWALGRVGSAGGEVVQRPAQISEAALAVLEHPRIHLPDSARWDIYSGAVDDALLTMMARAAERHEIAIVTVATGHPKNVFATDITSNHTLGRAVDIFSVDGEKVVESRKKGSPAFRLARWLYNQGVPELGSPWAFDGVGGRSFTDIVHADHIHFAM